MKRIIAIIIACCLLGSMSATPAAGRTGVGTDDLTIEEILLMAKVMQLENGNNSDLCVLLTGSVILNRRNSPEWPNTVQGVIYQKGQYADWTLRHIPTVKVTERVMALTLKLTTNGTLDEEIIFQSMHPELGHVKYKVDTDYFATK